MTITRRAFLGMSAVVTVAVGLVVAGQLTGAAGRDEACPTTSKEAAEAAASPAYDTAAIAVARVYVAAPAAPQLVPEDCWPDDPAEADTPPATQRATPPDPATAAGSGAPAAEAGTTGVAAGVALAAGESGTFDEDGLVIEGVHITGDLMLTGDNQVLRNSRVDGMVTVRGAGGQVIEDSEVGALSVSGATSFTARRVEVFGLAGSDGIHITSDTGRAADVVIESSWIHSPAVTAGSHYDGVQVRGVDRLTLRGNTIDLGTWAPQYNAAVFLESANGGNAGVTIEGNVINGGGYSMYLNGSDIAVTGNQFGSESRWGLLYPEHARFTATGNTWQDTGAAVSLP
jgi:hypothetical protein